MSTVFLPTNEDRRRRPRIELVLPIEDMGGGPPLVAQDIGMGGMLCTTSKPRWPGQHMQVRFRLPGQPRAVRATCRVVDLVEVPRGVGLSLKFLALAPKAELAILRFIGAALKTRMKRELEERKDEARPND